MSGDGPDHPMDPELDAYYRELGERIERETPKCSACGTKMSLVEYERPGSPPGNCWRCLTCNPLKKVDPLCPTGECVGTCDPEAHGL